MTNRYEQYGLKRIFLGIVLTPLLPSIIYTFIAWGVDLFIPFFYFVVFTAYVLMLVVLAPIFLVFIFKNRLTFLGVILSSFLSLCLIFILFFIWNDAGFTSLTVGSEQLVVDGQLTVAGYKNIAFNSMLIGFFGALGGVIFYIIVKPSKE